MKFWLRITTCKRGGCFWMHEWILFAQSTTLSQEKEETLFVYNSIHLYYALSLHLERIRISASTVCNRANRASLTLQLARYLTIFWPILVECEFNTNVCNESTNLIHWCTTWWILLFWVVGWKWAGQKRNDFLYLLSPSSNFLQRKKSGSWSINPSFARM